MKKTALLVSLACLSMGASSAELDPDPKNAYTLDALQALPKTPVLVRTVLGGDYGQTPVDLKAFFTRVDGGFGNGKVLVMQTDPTDDKWKDVGVAFGMSGSPIYDPANGKMLGALSYSLGDAGYQGKILFYATPVALMAQSLLPASPAKGARLSADPAQCDSGDPSQPIQGANRLLPITVSGLSEALAKKALKNVPHYHLAGGKGAAADAAPSQPLQAGSAVSVPLAIGDAFNAYVIGTATTVFGNQVMAFGHPFYNLGKVNYPLYGALIDGIDHYVSETGKNGILSGPALGSINQDRRAGISGSLDTTAKPDTIPVSIRAARNGQTFTYQEQVSRIETFSFDGNYTDWVAISLMAGLEQAFEIYGPQTVKVTTSLKVKGYKSPVELTYWASDSVSAPFYVGYKVYLLLNQAKSYGFELAQANFDAKLYDTNNSYYIDRVDVVGRIIAGAPVHLKVTAHDAQQKTQTKDLYLDVPDGTQGQSIQFTAGPASELYENAGFPANPTVKEWAEDMANRGKDNELMVKLSVFNPFAPDALTVASQTIPLAGNNKVVMGITGTFSMVEMEASAGGGL